MGIPSSGYANQSVTNPGGALTDFTLIIDLADVISDQADFSTDWNTDTGGYGKATKGDGTTELATDWFNLDNGAETGWVRVKWSGTLASSGTQTVRLWPPNTGNDLYAAGDTYGSDNAYDSGWEAYWPMFDANDRTSNGNDLTAGGDTTFGDDSTGPTGMGTAFDGNDYAVADSLVSVSEYTVIVWGKDAETGAETLVSQNNGSDENTFMVRSPTSLSRFSDIGYIVVDVNDVTGWGHYALAYDDATLEMYQEGINTDTDISGSGTLYPATGGSLSLARNDSFEQYLTGSLSDTQIHSVARSADWVAEEYSQTNDNAAFWGTWNWTAAGVTDIFFQVLHKISNGIKAWTAAGLGGVLEE